MSSEGRVVIPAEVRRALGVSGGDRLRLVLEDGEVRMTTARSMALGLWANNRGGDGEDAVADVRRFRRADRELSEARFEGAPGRNAVDPRSEDEIADGLLAELGVDG